ncbi:hypothetical protein [Neorhizobium petrolearium]|uniref:hypothetical protein n=1 Tax=Neorhizobium petrolearium TaxID=515361 RepID=UPI003F18E69E
MPLIIDRQFKASRPAPEQSAPVLFWLKALGVNLLAKAGTNRRRIGDIVCFPVCSPRYVVGKQYLNHKIGGVDAGFEAQTGQGLTSDISRP